jgi:iron(III) transport system substrate-binding protein
MTSERFGIGVVLLLLAGLVGVPFLMASGRDGGASDPGAPRLIVVTPHTQQIRSEFGRAFSAWHEREFGERVTVDFRTPGGTSEIRRQLEAQFRAAAATGQVKPAEPGEGGPLVAAGAIGYDVMFGGGSYDHGTLKAGIRVRVNGEEIGLPLSVPMDFSQAELDELFGPNTIGTQELYDPDQFWIGTALSSFGILYNRDVIERLGVPAPRSFDDLTDPRLTGWVALADPRLSGSITTTFDSILGNYGWDEGWRILRGMSGNARYFTNSSTKPPLDVGAGEAAVGLAIDFYGRGQAQVLAEGGKDLLAYVEPAGAVYIDADPVSIIRGGPNPELARRFVRFCLTERGQALWQFHATSSPEGASNPVGADGNPLGPDANELRRMPVRRLMYEEHFDHFMDRVVPFDLASDVTNPGWRTGVQIMMGAFGIDSADECQAAWTALAAAETDPDFPPGELAEMRRLFYSFPTTPVNLLRGHHAFGGLSEEARQALPEGRMVTLTEVREGLKSGALSLSPGVRAEIQAFLDIEPEPLPFTEATYRAVRNEWRNPAVEARSRIAYTRYFRATYAKIQRMYLEHGAARP